MKINKICLALVLVIAFISINSYSQMGIGTESPNSKAMLDIDVSEFSGGANKKGFLPPRMTSSERSTFGNTLDTDHESMLVFDLTDHLYYYWDGTQWVQIGGGSSYVKNGGTIYFTGNSTKTNLSEDTPKKIAGTTSSTNLQGDVNAGTNGRLTYTGTDDKIFTLTCSISIDDIKKEKEYRFFIYKTGVADATMRAHYETKEDNPEKAPITITGTIELSTNDYVELWVENRDSGNDIQIENFNLTIAY